MNCVSTCKNPCVGAQIIWTVKACNNGTTDSTNVQLVETIPAGLAVASMTPTSGSVNIATGVWTIGNLPAQTCYTMEIVATVSGTINFPLTARSVISTTDTETNLGNNVAVTSLTCSNMTDCDCQEPDNLSSCTDVTNACECGKLSENGTLCVNGETLWRLFGTPVNATVTIDEISGEYNVLPTNQTEAWSFEYRKFCNDNCTGAFVETGPYGPCTVSGGPEVVLDPDPTNIIVDNGDGLLVTASAASGDSYVNNATYNAATGVVTLENSGGNPDVTFNISPIVSQFTPIGPSSYTHTNGLGTFYTFPVVSTDANNIITVGSDRGAFFNVSNLISSEQCGNNAVRVSTVDGRLIVDINALLNCLPEYPSYTAAQTGGVAIGSYFRASDSNQLGLAPGSIVQLRSGLI